MSESAPSREDSGVRHLHALARRPRFTGSDEAARARAYCTAELEQLGFSVSERPFEYSAFPGRWATPAAGAVGVVIVVIVAWLSSRGRPGVAVALALVLSAATAGIALWMARTGILTMRALRMRGVNLVATRGGASPRVWLVAHADSKSQLVPMALRVASIALLGAALAIIVLLATLVWIGGAQLPPIVWWVVGGLGVLGGAGVSATIVGNHSPGAADNASGVATVLAAAASLPSDASVGVLITDAEELGLAGARALARELPPSAALNVDGVDDEGTLRVMSNGRPEGSRRLRDALLRAARAEETDLLDRRLIPGVLVDAVALRDAGWEAVTLSRGTVRTLTRIHTAADDLAGMTGRGIPLAARVLARAAGELA